MISRASCVATATRISRPAYVTAHATEPSPESVASAIPAGSVVTGLTCPDIVLTTQACCRPVGFCPPKFAAERNSTDLPSADITGHVHPSSAVTRSRSEPGSPGRAIARLGAGDEVCMTTRLPVSSIVARAVLMKKGLGFEGSKLKVGTEAKLPSNRTTHKLFE